MSLHNRVMNLPCKTPASEHAYGAFERGHKTARHAAAELALPYDALLSAAESVIARWDTPNWKVAAPTAEVIGELRAAIAKAKGEV